MKPLHELTRAEATDELRARELDYQRRVFDAKEDFTDGEMQSHRRGTRRIVRYMQARGWKVPPPPRRPL